MFLYTLMEVTARVTDIICIAQITFEYINNICWFTIVGFNSVSHRSSMIFLLVKILCKG